jgi:hypothetical protein
MPVAKHKVPKSRQNYICTREEVKMEIQKALADNNVIRDRLWEERNRLMVSQMEISLEKKLIHQPITSQAKDEFANIHRTCDARGLEIRNMDDKLESMEKKIDTILEKIDKAAEKSSEEFERTKQEAREELKKTAEKHITREELNSFTEQFLFWRNILISGIVLSIFLAIIGIWIDKLNK